METNANSYLKRVLSLGLSPRVAWGVTALFLGLIIFTLSLHRTVWEPFFKADFIVSPPVFVISSDDWGSREDSVEDLNRLADVLRGFQDRYGHPAVVTAYMNPACPDVDRIAESGFQHYAWKFCYSDNPELVDRWNALVAEGLFEIEFHGREHINVPLFMDLLKTDAHGFRQAVLNKRIAWHCDSMWDSRLMEDPRFKYFYRSFIDASIDPPRALPRDRQIEIIQTGLQLMHEHFEVAPQVLTPPGYVWDLYIGQALRACGLEYLDAARMSIVGVTSNQGLEVRDFVLDWGSNPEGIQAIIRTDVYEPTERVTPGQRIDLDDALWGVRRNLAAGSPVVLVSHCQHYIGPDQSLKQSSLQGLRRLIQEVRICRPKVAFLSAADLGHYIYGRPERARRQIPFQLTRLSPAGKAFNVFRGLWLYSLKTRLALTGGMLMILWAMLVSFIGLFRFYAGKPPDRETG